MRTATDSTITLRMQMVTVSRMAGTMIIHLRDRRHVIKTMRRLKTQSAQRDRETGTDTGMGTAEMLKAGIIPMEKAGLAIHNRNDINTINETKTGHDSSPVFVC